MKDNNYLQTVSPDRIINIEGFIDHKTSSRVNKALLKFDAKNDSPILLHLNSSGGRIVSAFSIMGIMRIIKSPLYTFTSGEAGSSAALIFMNGDKNFRFIDKHSVVTIHYVSFGDVSDEHMSEKDRIFLNNYNKNVENFIVSVTNQNRTLVKKYLRNETSFTSKEAVKFGIADVIC